MKARRAILLTSHLVNDPQPLSPTLWRHVKQAVDLDDEAFEMFLVGTLSSEDAARAQARLQLDDELDDQLAKLSSANISVVTEFDGCYPARWLERIPKSIPPILYCSGSTELLGSASVGVVGSRDVGDSGSSFACDCAEVIATLGLTLVSGGARGVDQIAMRRATEQGGSSLGILGDSLARASALAFDDGGADGIRLCLCSPFVPTAPFSVGNAMSRNKLIYAHSVATIVVSAAEGSGGTWNGALEALRGSLCGVLVWDQPELPGNQKLIRLGGRPIRDASGLAGALSEAGPAQGSLFE